MSGLEYSAEVLSAEKIDAEKWRTLLPVVRPGNQFLSFSWFDSWQSAFLNTGNWQGPIRYLTVKLKEELIGVLPLAVQTKSVLRFLSLPGNYLPFRDIPINYAESEQVANVMVRKLTQMNETDSVAGVRIGPIEESSTTFAAFKTAFERNQWHMTILQRGELLYLNLPATVDEYIPVVRGRAKKADYFLRRLRKRGDVSVTVHTELAISQWEAVIRELQTVESESWVAHTGEPRFLGDQNFRFWMSLLKDPGFGRAIKVWMLYFNAKPVSFCLVLDAGPVRYQLINGYSETAKKFSTGYILFKSMIYDSIESGIKSINFGQGDPGHKAEWGAKPNEHIVDLLVIKPGIFGKLLKYSYLGSKKIIKDITK